MKEYNFRPERNNLLDILRSGQVKPISEWFNDAYSQDESVPGSGRKFVRLGATATNGLILAAPRIVKTGYDFSEIFHRELVMTHLQSGSPLRPRMIQAITEKPQALDMTPIVDAGLIDLTYDDGLVTVDLFDQSYEFGRASDEEREITLEIARAALPPDVIVRSSY